MSVLQAFLGCPFQLFQVQRPLPLSWCQLLSYHCWAQKVLLAFRLGLLEVEAKIQSRSAVQSLKPWSIVHKQTPWCWFYMDEPVLSIGVETVRSIFPNVAHTWFPVWSCATWWSFCMVLHPQSNQRVVLRFCLCLGKLRSGWSVCQEKGLEFVDEWFHLKFPVSPPVSVDFQQPSSPLEIVLMMVGFPVCHPVVDVWLPVQTCRLVSQVRNGQKQVFCGCSWLQKHWRHPAVSSELWSGQTFGDRWLKIWFWECVHDWSWRYLP